MTTAIIGIVIVSHAPLASAFKAACEHVVGKQEQLEIVDIGAHDDMAARNVDISVAIKAANRGAGVVILTDMFGGTPSNLAIAAMHGNAVEVIAGVNLPMLVKLATLRQERLPLPELVAVIQEAARKYINVASAFLQSG